jgi:sarcosine oxidase gamma subunit
VNTQIARELEARARIHTLRRLTARAIDDRPHTDTRAVSYLSPRERLVLAERQELRELEVVA